MKFSSITCYFDVRRRFVRMAAGLAPPNVGYFVLIAERAKQAEPTTETSAVARTGGERHTPTFGCFFLISWYY